MTGRVAPRFMVLGSTGVDVSRPPSDLGRDVSWPPSDLGRVPSECGSIWSQMKFNLRSSTSTTRRQSALLMASFPGRPG